mmetsp:Transcript_8890/g.19080  ORF Transcript_8890/g.19080 Transcript_8890/m.19080 type:complete len:182 (-) Transcript_8890:214-759(-)
MVARSLKVIGTFAASLSAGASAFSPTSTSAATATVRPRHGVVSREPSPPLFALNRNVVTMMPTTLDRPAVKVGGGPAVLDRPAVAEKKSSEAPTKERKSVGSEAWEVRIYNDGVNTREFVARCLVQITGLTEMGAYQTMMQAHHNGLAVVGRYPYERAEMYHDALKTNGILCDLVPVDEEG